MNLPRRRRPFAAVLLTVAAVALLAGLVYLGTRLLRPADRRLAALDAAAERIVRLYNLGEWQDLHQLMEGPFVPAREAFIQEMEDRRTALGKIRLSGGTPIEADEESGIRFLARRWDCLGEGRRGTLKVFIADDGRHAVLDFVLAVSAP